jgi:NADP-dependent 3-hydroxy acid dehydrogenase YdfG
MKKLDYKNKTVIITGASSGIGKEIASELIENYGCTVYGIARNESRLSEAKSLLGDKFIPYSMDVGFRHVRENVVTRNFEYILRRNKDGKMEPVSHE